MKTQHCDQCKHATMRAQPKPVLICAMLHKPRFYAPVYWLKDSWGWKRKCEDFMQNGPSYTVDPAIATRFGKNISAMREREHITDGGPCWCNPETTYTDPDTGASVIVHRDPQ